MGGSYAIPKRSVGEATGVRRPIAPANRPTVWSAIVGALVAFGSMTTCADERLYGS